MQSVSSAHRTAAPRHTHVLLVGIVALALALAMTLAPSAGQFKVPASAAADTQAPVITLVSNLPATVNPDKAPVTVSIDLRVTDATGTTAPVVEIPAVLTRQYLIATSTRLVSGTAKDGVWRLDFRFARGMVGGSWRVYQFPGVDVLGNRNLGSVPVRIGEIQVLTTAPLDSTAPILAAQSVSPAAGNLATGPVTVKARLQLKDATGARGSLTWIENPAGLKLGENIRMHLASGTAQDGWWESSFTIPANAVTGTWSVRSAMPQDIFGYDGTPPIGLPRTLLLGTVQVNRVVPKTLTATPVPKISGTVAVGKKLTAVPGVWSPTPVTLKYQWLRNGVAISTATASTFTLTATDQGKKITLKVTGSKTGYTTAAKTSASTVLVAKGTLVAPVPKISGTVAVGKKLTAVPGVWSPAPVSLKYQWLRNGGSISTATASTYTLTTTDLGKKITLKVTGTKTGYNTAAKTSAPTAAVAKR